MSEFKVGDKVKVVSGTCSGFVNTTQGKRAMFKGDLVSVVGVGDKYIDVELSCGARASGWSKSRFKLVEQVPDMTKNERPFGLLSKEEQKVLLENPRNLQRYSEGGWRDKIAISFSPATTYRVNPKPLRVPISELTGTVEMMDGKPNWNSYRED